MFPVIIPIVCIIAYGAVDYYQNNFFEGSIDYWNLRSELKSKLYGQSDVVNYLDKDYRYGPAGPYGVQVTAFTGGPGVGKTYTASILMKHYRPQEMIINIFPSIQSLNEETLTITTQKLKKVTKGFGLVIVDGIDFNSLDLLHFILQLDFFSKKHKLYVKVIVIGEILKIHSHLPGQKSVESFQSIKDYVDFIKAAGNSAQKRFRDANLNCEIILFMPLSIDTVKQCISYAVETKIKKPLLEYQLEDILNQIFELHSDFSPSGCKDVDSYVNLLPVKLR